jgi:uncharacterized membrane protein YdbT with pleckstrin-like domain
MGNIYKASRKAPSVVGSISKRSIEVELTPTSIIYRSGILTKKVNEIPYSKVNSVSVKQSLHERALGYGDVVVLTGNDVNGIVLENIDNPSELRDAIMSKINT